MEPLTRVIFRKFPEGDVIALFPEIPGSNDTSTCMSYMHVGQHGAASVNLVNNTKPATQNESGPLVCELTNLGYRLTEVKKFSRKDFARRWEQVYSINNSDRD
jgi:hypothetical protein